MEKHHAGPLKGIVKYVTDAHGLKCTTPALEDCFHPWHYKTHVVKPLLCH